MRGSGVRESSELVVLYEISVRVGEQPLSHVRHRYRDFHKLQVTLRENYPHLFAERQELPLPMTPLLEGFLDGPTITPAAPLPPFPRKHLFRAGWDPAVVTERVVALDAWLSAVCDKLQFASLELVGFLNVPLYAAIRLLSGDLQPDDFTEPCSPDTVMGDNNADTATSIVPRDPSAPGPQALHEGGKLGRASGGGSCRLTRSPACDRRSLHQLASQLRHSVQRPGFNESALLVAKAIVAHSVAAGVTAPSLDEARRFVRAVCGRALFKPCSLIATVVYMERLRRTQIDELLQADGWQLTLLVLLVIAAKVWDSDYPISNADICAPGALPRTATGDSRPLSTRRVNDGERRVLAMLDYSTFVSPAEFARYYLTLPFAFPSPVAAPTQPGGAPTLSERSGSPMGTRSTVPSVPPPWPQLPPSYLSVHGHRHAPQAPHAVLEAYAPPPVRRSLTCPRASACASVCASACPGGGHAGACGGGWDGFDGTVRFGGLVQPALLAPSVVFSLSDHAGRCDSLP